MPNRYANRRVKTNASEKYRDQFEKRRINFIKHFRTPEMTYPNIRQKASLTRHRHIWKLGDRYYKLASQYYGSADLWWIIAWYNQKPTESHVTMGEVVYVPLPLENVYAYMRTIS